MLDQKRILVYVDTREFNSDVINYLSQFDCILNKKMLVVADYLLSDRVCIERKTTQDFIASITDQRIFKQVKEMKNNFEKPLLMIEGDRLYDRINPNIVRGVLAALAIDFMVPIIWTKDPQETAGMIYWIARREQLDLKREVAVRGTKKTESIGERQEFLVAGLPGISSVRARKMLKHFKTPEKVFSASEDELAEVEKLGKKTAKQIRDILEKEYG